MGNSGEGSEKQESYKEILKLLRDYLSGCDQSMLEIHMDDKDNPEKVSDGKRETILENWRKGHLCYKVAKNLAEMCPGPRALQKAEFKSY